MWQRNARTSVACKQVLPNHPLAQLFVFDFDECLVDTHISKCMSEERDRRPKATRGEQSELIFGHSDEALAGLSNAWRGATRAEIEGIARQVCAKASWRPGAQVLVRRIVADPSRAVIVATSGMGLGIRTWLGLHSLTVAALSSELTFDPYGVCDGYSVLVSDEAKAQLVRLAKACGRFGAVIAVGHSYGDRLMLAEADISVALKDDAEVEALCDYVIHDFSEIDLLALQPRPHLPR